MKGNCKGKEKMYGKGKGQMPGKFPEVKMAKGGSVCRGGGAATKGTKFKGVK